MKNILIKIIRLYQKTPFHSHTYCRFIPTCSEYTILSIKEHGAIKGLYYGIKRICKCNPWGKSGIDNIITKEKK